MAGDEFRLRLCCGKRGRLRFLSHLEYSHAFERGARRAAIPYSVTKGFSPHMKAAFGPALPVGTQGLREYIDVWLTRYVAAETVLAALGQALPGDLAPTEAGYAAAKEPSLGAACTIGVYEVRVEGGDVAQDIVSRALDDVVGAGVWQVEHKGKTKVFDLAESLPKEMDVRSTGEAEVVVGVTTRMGQGGSLRPDSLVSHALSRAGVAGAVTLVTRLDTLIETEEGTFRRPI